MILISTYGERYVIILACSLQADCCRWPASHSCPPDVQSSGEARQAVVCITIVRFNSAFSMMLVFSGFLSVVATSVWASSCLNLDISVMQSSKFGRFCCRIVVRRFVVRVPVTLPSLPYILRFELAKVPRNRFESSV